MEPADKRLTYKDLLRVSWLIAWRYFVMLELLTRFIAVVLLFGLVGILSTLGVPGHVIDSIGNAALFAAPFLVYYPLVMAMMLNKEFRDFRIDVIDEQGTAHTLGFVEHLLLGLFFAVSAYASSLPLSVMLSRFYSAPIRPAWAALAVSVLWHVFVAYPVILRIMLRQRVKGLHMEVIRRR